MKIVKKLVPEEHGWLTAEPLLRLMNILNDKDGNDKGNNDKASNDKGNNARLVGGCVRDTLMGRAIKDIDIACRLRPEIVMARLEAARVKVIATGLKHGTVTAIIDKKCYEITTLRRDMETDGRHARVAYSEDWAEDAARRDFTFNALYLDLDGSLYDPCGGMADIAARHVRFIGDAGRRIEEDALRILRYFRFAAQIGRGKMDRAGLGACKRHKSLIDHLSGERLAQEIFKILPAENVLTVMAVMADSGILDHILPGHAPLEEFNKFVRLEKELGRCDMLMRLSCLLPADKAAAARISRHLRLSNKMGEMLIRYAGTAPAKPDLSERDMRRLIYGQGREAGIFALLQGGYDDIAYAENWPIPVFPVQGRDLQKAGLSPGPEMGLRLQKLEAIWIDSDFRLSRKALLGKDLSGAGPLPKP